MDKPKINKNAETIEIKANSKKEFFLIHGYTGSPTDFNQLGKYLNKRFNANVKIVRLIGHGETIDKLDNLHYKDFLNSAEAELKKDLKKGRKIIIGGLSIGAFISLHLSSKYPVKGTINISVPYTYKFFTSILAFLEPIIPKKHFKKPIPKVEQKMRKNAFYYDVHLGGFRIIGQAKKELDEISKKVDTPCLLIHIEKDIIFDQKSMELIKRKINSKVCDLNIYKDKDKTDHNPFFSPSHRRLYKVIGDFVEKYKLFD